MPPNAAEKERLAKALRDNLRRRKAQARGPASSPEAEQDAGVDSQQDADEAQVEASGVCSLASNSGACVKD